MTLAPSLKLEGLKLAGLLLVGTLLGLAGIDLILPTVPTLPEALGGSHTQAQGVLAAYLVVFTGTFKPHTCAFRVINR